MPGRRRRFRVVRCHLPTGLLGWGWNVQLYATRSRASWGIGDLADLRALTRWAADAGATFVGVNPLHAPLPTPRQQPSPYFPSSRLYRSPLYLRVEEVPGATDGAAGATVAQLAAAGRALNAERRIDRDAVWRLKRAALEAIRRERRDGDDPGFEAWRANEGGLLARYATFCALVDHHGTPWPTWPAAYRRPDTPEVARFTEEHAERIQFHQWLQWLLDEQLAAAAGQGVALVHDLAVGVDPDGADAWLWPDLTVDGVHVGAPPDEFNTQGQDWGVAAWDPARLKAAGYEPFVRTLRANLRHAGGLRVDHVMGLFRLFWVPAGRGPSAGRYVRYPARDLIARLAAESRRATAVMVGEDLGTVQRSVRRRLARRQVLSTRLLWFEEEPPAEYPRQALAAVTTHDLPTVAGLWTGADLDAQRRLGLHPNEASVAHIRDRLRAGLRLADGAPVGEVVRAVYAWLAEAPSMLVSATLEDALEVVERPNMPGTVDQWPNWSLALPLPLEEIVTDPRPATIAELLGGRTP